MNQSRTRSIAGEAELYSRNVHRFVHLAVDRAFLNRSTDQLFCRPYSGHRPMAPDQETERSTTVNYGHPRGGAATPSRAAYPVHSPSL